MAALRFAPKDRVRVLALGMSGHVRIPHYVRLRYGLVVSYCGSFLNPEDLAVGITSGPARDLYRIAFQQRDLWSDGGHADHDRLIIEIYDHWLEPA